MTTKQTVQQTYFVDISFQRSCVTTLAETWHSAGILEPNDALYSAVWKEQLIVLAKFQAL